MGAALRLVDGGEPPNEDLDAGSYFARGDHVELAEHVLTALGPDPITFDAGEFWRYAPHLGVWEKLHAHKIRATAAGFAGARLGFGKEERQLKITAGATVGAEAIARDLQMNAPGRVTFEGAPVGAAFANGFVTVEGGEITVREHGPGNRARHAYPMPYAPWEPSATPLLQEFLEQLFADCSEAEGAARAALLQEFAGACLMGDALRYQACLILYGEGANGKSSLLALLRAMFPADALSSIAPQRWAERFGLAGLEGKRANFVSETPSAEILDGGAFKAVVTGDVVTAERKNKDPFEMRPIAGHIFSMNWPLVTTDHSAGFWRRPVILPFSRRFDRDPGRRIEPERAVIEGELGGVVAWAVEGAARAQRQGAYTLPDQSRALLGEWRDGSDQVLLFLATEAGETGSIPASRFYERYREWAAANGHRNAVTSRMFGLRVMASDMYARTEGRGGRVYQRKAPPGASP